jgi:hypothetical protein
VYGPADLEPNLALRSRAAYLWVGCRAVLGGYSAAEPLSAGCAPVDAPAELMLAGAHLRAPSGVMVHQTKVAGEEHVEYGDLVLTTPVRTAYDLGRCPLDEAVVAVDALSARFGFEPKDVLSFAERYTGARDSFRLPSVIALAEPRTESPMETRLRLVLLRGGLHPPCAQYTVVDQLGHFVARVDFATRTTWWRSSARAPTTPPTSRSSGTDADTPAWQTSAGASTATLPATYTDTPSAE